MSGSHNKHARLSPSGAERWGDCTASVAFVEKLRADGKIPQREPDNVYAVAGTYAHDMAEAKLLFLLGRTDVDPFEKYEELNKKTNHKAWLKSQDFFEIKDKDILDEMEGHDFTDLEEYVDYCLTRVTNKKDRVHVEVRASLFYSDDTSEKGTCDFLIEHADKSISIVDLKWRRSGMVESYENYQLAIYCMSYITEAVKVGFMKEPSDDTNISLATFNPIIAPHVKPWDTSYGQLKRFCQRFFDAKDTIEDGTYTVFVPTSKACKWCEAAKHKKCPALNAKVKFALPNTLDIDAASDDELVRFFQFFPELKEYASRVQDYLTRLAENGDVKDGVKLVKGRDGNRKFIDKDEAIDEAIRLGLVDEDIYKPQDTKTPTQIGKVIKKKAGKDALESFEKNFTERPEGKKTLVADTDDRPTVTSVKQSLFKGLK